MEFNEKLQELRKQNNFTQEDLAEKLFVSRTAVSKWESGRGYPNIDSLKAIAKVFGISIDELLPGDELLSIAEEDTKQKEGHIRDIVFGLLDISVLMLLFLPVFDQRINNILDSTSLLSLTEISSYLKTGYFVVIGLIILIGILTLALQNCAIIFWTKNKSKISLFANVLGVILFVVSQQPYAATILLIYLIIKALMLIKW